MDAPTIARSLALFGVAAVLEIGGAWLVWQAIREGRGWALALAGGLALFLYGFVATFQTDPHFGRVEQLSIVVDGRVKDHQAATLSSVVVVS